jgi:hypothetical protein
MTPGLSRFHLAQLTLSLKRAVAKDNKEGLGHRIINVPSNADSPMGASIAKQEITMQNGFHQETALTAVAPVALIKPLPEQLEQAPSRLGILEKMAKVYETVAYVQRDRRNSFHNYTYASEAAIKERIHAAFVAHGLVMLPYEVLELTETEPAPRVNDKGGQFLTTMKVRFSIADVDTGEIVHGTAYGRGQDNGDKGPYKALTGALKYFLTTTFLIATGDDPEVEEPATEEPVRNRRPKAAPTQAPEARSPQAAPVAAAQPPSRFAISTRQQFFGANSAGRRAAFGELLQAMDPDVYATLLSKHGADKLEDFQSANQAWAAYQECHTAALDYLARQADPANYAHFQAQGGVQ